MKGLGVSDEVELHPIATMFPAMAPSDFERLKADIAANGQCEPITFWRDQLIDGRHRLRACRELKIDPLEQMLDDDHPDPIGYAISQNLHRRHLKTFQRAIVAARMEQLANGQRKAAMQNCIARDEVAQLCNVSPRSIATARVVIDRGYPELADAVQAGSIPLALAAKLASAVEDHDEQREISQGGAAAIRSYFIAADELHERENKRLRAVLAKAVAQLHGRERIEAIAELVERWDEADRNSLLERLK